MKRMGGEGAEEGVGLGEAIVGIIFPRLNDR